MSRKVAFRELNALEDHGQSPKMQRNRKIREGRRNAAENSKTGNEFNFAAGLAAYAMLLRNSEYKGNADYSMVKELIKSAEKPSDGVDPLKLRSKLLDLIEIASKK